MSTVSSKYYRMYSQDVQKSNIRSLKIFAAANILISVMNIFDQVFQRQYSFYLSLFGLAYAVAVFIATRFLKDDKDYHCTLLMYLAIAPALLITVLNGSVLDTEYLAFTFLIMVVALPPMILYYPWATNLYSASFCALLLILSYNCKQFVHFREDTVHVITSFIASAVLTYITNDARMNVVIKYHEEKFRADHDTLTGLKDSSMVGGAFDKEMLSPDNIDRLIRESQSAARVDKMTGLYNMMYFLERAAEICSFRQTENKHPCMVNINIENFKKYNSTYGYAEGDKLLCTVADCIRKEFNDRISARFSSDNFMIMMYRHEVTERLPHVMESISRQTAEHPVHIIVGFYEFNKDDKLSYACDCAKIAGDSIKSDKTQTICEYDDAMDERLRSIQYVMDHLDEAIEKGYIQVYYQKIVDAETGEQCDSEALARWIHPEYGMLSPAVFIPPLENSGLIYKLDLEIIRQVIECKKHARERGKELFPSSVNISRKDLLAVDMVEKINGMMDEAGLDHSLLNIEITESAVGIDPDLIRDTIRRFHEKGFQVWMDDFGSGYSSLNLLPDFDFDLIKLDMKFVRNANSYKTKIVIKEVFNMAENLGVDTLTEGVETADQAEDLKELGCDKLQGFYFGRPEPEPE